MEGGGRGGGKARDEPWDGEDPLESGVKYNPVMQGWLHLSQRATKEDSDT